MICSACRHQSESSAKFCSQCGARLSLSCPACSAPVKEDAKFCSECGAALKVSAASAPETFTVSGEKKHITVLFADVAGSMDLQEELDAEVWAQIVGRFVSILAEGVRRLGGTVDKFTGDGIMALFGAPVAQEDHARRACHAAWHLTKAIGEYSEELRRERGVELHVRLGLNSGEVVVGRVGDDVTLDPTALGHTVGLAQRMEGLAEPGKAFLTEYTARLVEGWFGLDDLGEMAVKGSRERLPVYVLGPALSSPVRRRVGASRLVGRERELAVLEDALAMAEEGHAQVVGVVGEAGVGKSRLCEEFAASAVGRGITVRRTAGVSHGGDVPLLPILALFRDYFGITETDIAEQARRKIARRLLDLDPALDETLPLLYDFLEVPDPARPIPQLAPEVRMRRLFETLGRMTARRSQQEALVVLFEDLHWFDEQSQAFLGRLIDSFPGSRTLVVANFRPEFSARWMRHSYYRQLPLAPLQDTAVGELLGGLLGTGFSLAPLLGFVKERTGGNPFFVEEVVRALVEDGTLVGTEGRYQLTRPLHEVAVPASVHAVIAARIDRLPREQKAILQTASVIGRTFDIAVLGEVSGSTDDDLGNSLSSLCAAELLQEAGHGAVAEYRFWHPLTQEVAYGTLLGERRARLHGAVATALAELDPRHGDERAALIAFHFDAAGDHLQAARWNARAAGWAQRASVDEGIRRAQAAIAHLDQVAETDDSLALGVRARIHLLRLGSRVGIDPATAEALFAEGRARAERLADPGLLGLLTAVWGSVRFWRGDLSAGRACYYNARRLVVGSTDVELRFPPSWAVATACLYMGPVDEGLSSIEEAIALCGDDVERGAQSVGYSGLVHSLLLRAHLTLLAGRLKEGRDEFRCALTLAREHKQWELLARGLPIVAEVAFLTGDGESGLVEADEARRMAEDSGNAFNLVLALEAIGIAQVLDRRPTAAIEMLTRGLNEARNQQVGLFEEANLLAHLARAHLRIRHSDLARKSAAEAVQVARSQQARIPECLALTTRAGVLRQTDGPRGAPDHDLRSALTLACETGAKVYEPFIREELGRLHSDETELRQALRLYRQIGATGHARRLEAELSARSVR